MQYKKCKQLKTSAVPPQLHRGAKEEDTFLPELVETQIRAKKKVNIIEQVARNTPTFITKILHVNIAGCV